MKREAVLGVDSSTQSTKVMIVDLETGVAIAESRAPHSGLNLQDPNDWWHAMRSALAAIDLDAVQLVGLSVAGQQHGLVTIGADGETVRPAPLWNNVDAAADAERLNREADFPGLIGSRLVAAFTIAKLAHMKRTDPAGLAATRAIGLPHDWLNFKLTGRLASDRGDASGTGWWSPIENRIMPDLIALAVGEADARRLRSSDVLGPEEPCGRVSDQAADFLGLPTGLPVAAGSGDNMAAALGIGASEAEIVVSLGTSGTAYAVSEKPTADQTGEVAGFADATGRYLPLACVLNCTRVVAQLADLLGLSLNDALDLAAATDPGAEGILLIPYFDGERTPNLPFAAGSIHGIETGNLTHSNLLRAAVDGVAANMAFCVGSLERVGVTGERIVLVGGGSAHEAWRQAIADVTGLPVIVLAGGEHVARGAAIQAAALARGESVAAVTAAWRPTVIAKSAPRAGAQASFRLEERTRAAEKEPDLRWSPKRMPS